MNGEEGIELDYIDLEKDLLQEVKQNEEDKYVDPEKLLKNQKSIYNIKSKNKNGIGFFCKIPDPDKNDNIIEVLFSCYHVIEIEVVNEISIASDKEVKNINLNDGRRKWWDKEIDYVCIEILEKDSISNFLTVFQDINDKKYQNEYIEKQLLYASNTIKISPGNGKLFPFSYLIYHFDTDFGWSGSPVFLNGDNKVIGIHKGGKDNNKDNKIIKKGKVINMGIPIKNVLIHMRKLGNENVK